MEIEAYLDGIAARLRAWRAAEGLTLQQVAARSAVAASTIQKIERRQMVPTVTVLFKIARGFGRSPAELIDEAAVARDVVHRRAAGVSASPPATEHLTGQLSDPKLSLWRVHVPAGEGASAPHLGPRGEVLILCESGRLETRVGDQVHTLAAGDSLHCKTRSGFAWRALGDEAAGLVLIGTSVLGLEQVLGGERVNRDASSSGPD
jgi:XRE family transcriptional regulator, regulator of sulfur utilization